MQWSTFAFEKIHALERRNKGTKKLKTLNFSQTMNEEKNE